MTSSRDPIALFALPDLSVVVAPVAADAPTPESLAWERGWDAAQAEASDAVARARADAASARDATLAAIAAAQTSIAESVQRIVPTLSLAIARVLIEREVSAEPAIVEHLVTRALAVIPLHGTISVRLHPDDLAALDARDLVADAAGVSAELRWMPDESLSRGSCMIDGPTSIVDGRIDRVLLDIYDRLAHD